MHTRVIGGWGFDSAVLAHLGAAQPWYQTLELTEPTVLIGWSLGGVVATEALDHPLVCGLVTLATPGHFGAQVDPRFFHRLQRSVQRDPGAALARFHPWIVGEPFDGKRADTVQLDQGLARLAASDCAGSWAQSPVAQLHLVGRDDVLFSDTDQHAIDGGHGFAWQNRRDTTNAIEAFIDAL
ncbi:alpha/beta fold hydrolase [Litorivicinus lipolyticus]|uniref:alpha/beta fold hydrolase n=1 Tax=Litorivicinus lipolyticus TaxID=418701 RepID=UPI003B592B7F